MNSNYKFTIINGIGSCVLGNAYGWKTFKKVLSATDMATCHLLSSVLALVVPSLDLHLPEAQAR